MPLIGLGMWTGAALLFPSAAHAYIGPGAGFAFVSSFFILFITFLLAFVTIMTWPLRWAIQTFRRRKASSKGKTKRVVILGLAGQDLDHRLGAVQDFGDQFVQGKRTIRAQMRAA
ncbi:hypothetical protein IIC65_08820, partial [Candidatus Sumerlaeota bacterium]|nr:hypothetical protein [Candidatus Sumerlaeota bacterium]